jgi:raffinose/stachyose/melibiose transport system permease protein
MTTLAATAEPDLARPAKQPRRMKSAYPFVFYLPAGVIYAIFFLVPTVTSLYFSLTRWTLFDQQFIGLDNFVQFFKEPALVRGFINTFIYAFITSGAKVVLGLLFGVLLSLQIIARGYLRSAIFFPVMVSVIGIGITWKALMDPTDGLINQVLSFIGIDGPGWLTNPTIALLSVALVDIWAGVGLATLIYIAGITSIPPETYEAAAVDGVTGWQKFWYIIVPLVRPATASVVLFSLIGGLRTFDLIWTMTKGGPGFTSDVLSSVIYKQYQAGFFGLSTAGSVVLIVVIFVLVTPLTAWLNRGSRER